MRSPPMLRPCNRCRQLPEADVDDFLEYFVVERLLQKFDGAELHRLDCYRNFTMSRHYGCGPITVPGTELPQKIDAASTRHSNVDQEEPWFQFSKRIQKILRIGERSASYADGP